MTFREIVNNYENEIKCLKERISKLEGELKRVKSEKVVIKEVIVTPEEIKPIIVNPEVICQMNQEVPDEKPKRSRRKKVEKPLDEE